MGLLTVGDIQSPQRIQTLVAGITPDEISQYNDKPFTLDSGGRGNDYRVLARLLPSSVGSVICAISLDGVERAMNQLRFLFLAVGFLVLIVLGLIARKIIDISLRPLKSVEETAEAFAKGDFSARLDEARTDTEVGRLTSALNQMLARIEEAFAVKVASEDKLRRFVADASHELRTPLTAIRGFSELHRQGAIKGEEKTSELIRRIEDESLRMSSLVEDLLLLARLDQSPEMLMEPVDLGRLINEVVESARAARNTHEISIELESEELFLLGDSLRIHQVIANLLANAQIHTPDGSKIIVSASQDDLATYISVSDNGPGISVESQERIFERFYRADLSRVRSGAEGTGLGIDTTWKFREMIEFRDQMADKYQIKLMTHTNQDGVRDGVTPFSTTASEYTRVMKTVALRQALDSYGFDAAIGGSRRDEEKSRAKERLFSVRESGHRWDPRAQRPELWRTYNPRIRPDQSMRVFPISDWTELDIWSYIQLH
ncbi:MAG: sulfate adenylyltransferase subunit CysD, partial [Actinobacteria bacterium]|nr:sulfate adenylyltransferase subunit CysD [Actinomycetota bacterium]